MPAKKPAAKSKKASKPVKTVARKVAAAKKVAKAKPASVRVADKRASEKSVVKKSPAAPKAIPVPAKPAPKAAPVAAKAAPKAKSVAPAPAPKVAAVKPAAKPAPAKAPVAAKPVVEETVATRQRHLAAAAAAADAEEADQEPGKNLLAGPRNVQPYIVKRGELYMGKEQLDHFRQILSNWKRDLMEEVDRTVLHMKDEAANFPDPNDRATQESEFSLELRTRDRERKLIRKIDEALKRIEDGSYGYCNETGEEIGVKRLEARPVATLSVEAQERRERREKQYGDRDDRYR